MDAVDFDRLNAPPPPPSSTLTITLSPCNISWMDKLPIELLSRIMVYVDCRSTDTWRQCCSNHFANDYGDYLPIRGAIPQRFGRLQLGMVCRFWKSISEGTPALWNRIAVDINATNDHNIEKTMSDLSKRLSRSRALPLEILVMSIDHILAQRSKREAWRRNTIMVLDELYLHSERFRSVSLHISIDFWAQLQYYKKSSHQLTHFCLVDEPFPVELKRHNVKAFWPSLTHLELGFVHFGDLSSSLAGLTCLKLVSVQIPTPWKAIESAQRLTHLVLDCCSRVDETESQSPVTLHSMKHFEYIPSCCPEDDFMTLFAFPALDVFILEDEVEPGYCIDELPLHSFLSACANSLQRIVLVELQRTDRPPPDCEILFNVLSTLPSLEYVEFGFTNMPPSYFDPLLARLTAPEGLDSAGFLPNLHSLKFNSPGGVSWPLIPTIFNRPGSFAQRPFRQLIVDNGPTASAEPLTIGVINKLVDLLKDGIDIQLYDRRRSRVDLREFVHGWTSLELSLKH